MGQPIHTPGASPEGKYLVFRLGEGVYGLSTAVVHEVLGAAELVAAPRASGHLRASIDHRGWLIPVIDLCTLLGCAAGRGGDGMLAVLVQGSVNGQVEDAGFLVDRILGVVRVDPVHIERPGKRARYAPGAELVLAVIGTEFGNVVLLDACRLLSCNRTGDARA